MSAIIKSSIDNVSSITSPQEGGSVAIPSGVQLATDTAANLVAASPTTVGQLRVASDTGDLYISDSDNKFHPTRAKAYAMDYNWDYSGVLVAGDTQTDIGALTAGANASSNRLVTSSIGVPSATVGMKIPPGFGSVLAVVTWSASGGAPTGFWFFAGDADFRKLIHVEQGNLSSGSFVFDATGLPGFDEQNMAAGTMPFHANCIGASSSTALDLVVDLVTTGSEFFYQTS